MTDIYSLNMNQQKIIDFLAKETFSMIKQMQFLLQQKNVQSTYQLLDKLINKKLVSKAILPVVEGRGVTLYGITSLGLALTKDVELYISKSTFQKSRVSITTLQHKLDIQYFHILMTRNGWINWTDGSQLGRRDKSQKIPDVVVTSPSKFVAGLEIEREAKSSRRIRDLIMSHLLSRKNGQWDKVIYLCPSPKLAHSLMRKFRSIKSINYQGKTIYLTENHFQIFEFYGYKKFEEKILNNEIY
jgi:hypothetical protein